MIAAVRASIRGRPGIFINQKGDILMKKFFTIVLILLLVIAAGGAGCYAAARQPSEVETAQASVDDLAGRAFRAAISGGTFTVSPGELNTLLIDRLPADDYPEIQSAQVGTPSESGDVTVALVMRYKKRNWAVTVTGTLGPDLAEGRMCGVTFAPHTVKVGKLPIPATVWQRVAAKWELYDAATGMVHIELKLPVNCTGLSVSPDGVTVTMPAPTYPVTEGLDELAKLWDESLNQIKSGMSWADVLTEWQQRYPDETVRQLAELFKTWIRAQTSREWLNALRFWTY